MAIRKAQIKAQTLGRPLRGDIYLVNFDPSLGSEIQKTRPALVIQNNIANRFSPITIVAAITSKLNDPPYPTEVILESAGTGLPLRSVALLNQIRSVDRQRLVERLGHANPDAMKRIDLALQISLGLVGV
jgi:mRNA interferase MazF